MKKLTTPFLILFLLFGCSQKEDSPVPSEILDLQRTELISGEAAAEIINHLHQQSVTQGDNYVARYGNNEYTATYYLSVYENETEAQYELQAMVASMERGGHVFDHVRPITVNERAVWMALGMGQAHYFYAEGSRLVWLAVDVPIAEDALKSIL
jgi:uncharacterized protein YcfL